MLVGGVALDDHDPARAFFARQMVGDTGPDDASPDNNDVSLHGSSKSVSAHFR